ncbi:MAG: fatty acid desaturase [Ignavibacterium sp.]|nr:MAG: fatty acid desaturase [Ignavibacterium sp.]
MNSTYFKELKMTSSGVFILVLHLVVIFCLPFYFFYDPPGLMLIILTIILLFLSEIGITAGYHRLYSHPTYRTVKVVEIALLWLATLTLQGSALRWSYDHRLHHANVDQAGDPYNIKRGFWFAHVLWLFMPPTQIQENIIPDLIKNKLLVWQHNNYYLFAILTNVITFAFVGWLTNQWLGAFILAVLVRLLFSYHFTWFINSLAHWWGEKSYSKELTARDNAILALLTVGEGYHNYHHTFPGDYRNGIRWYHFDLSKWLIYSLSKIGLTFDLHRYSKDKITKKLINMDKSLVLGRIVEMKSYPKKLKRIIPQDDNDYKSFLVEKVNQLSSSLKIKQEEISELISNRLYAKKDKVSKYKLREIRSELRISRRSYSTEWKIWTQLCSIILSTESSKSYKVIN